MSGRVLATQTAERAAVDMRNQLQSVQGVARQVLTLGDRLADPSVWDGPEAVRFRSEWPQMGGALRQLMPALESLQRSSETVVEQILKAGSQGSASPGGFATGGIPVAAIAGALKGADYLNTAEENFFHNFLVEVKGYTTKRGTVVEDYVRWRPGLATTMNEITAARNLEFLKYADKGGLALAGVAGVVGGYEQYQTDQASGQHYTTAQEGARVGVAGTLDFGEAVGAGATGMAIGAAVGSIVPGPGTVVGAGVGFLVGFGVSVGISVAIDHFQLNEHIENWLFKDSPIHSLFGG